MATIFVVYTLATIFSCLQCRYCYFLHFVGTTSGFEFFVEIPRFMSQVTLGHGHLTLTETLTSLPYQKRGAITYLDPLRLPSHLCPFRSLLCLSPLPLRQLVINYCLHSHDRCTIIERSCAGKYLWKYGMPVGKGRCK